MAVIHSIANLSIASISSMATSSGPFDLFIGIDSITSSISSFVNCRFYFSLLIFITLSLFSSNNSLMYSSHLSKIFSFSMTIVPSLDSTHEAAEQILRLFVFSLPFHACVFLFRIFYYCTLLTQMFLFCLLASFPGCFIYFVVFYFIIFHFYVLFHQFMNFSIYPRFYVFS